MLFPALLVFFAGFAGFGRYNCSAAGFLRVRSSFLAYFD